MAKMYTITEAAAELEMSRQGVHKILTRNRKIPRKIIEAGAVRYIMIPECSLALIAADKRDAGRPRKKSIGEK